MMFSFTPANGNTMKHCYSAKRNKERLIYVMCCFVNAASQKLIENISHQASIPTCLQPLQQTRPRQLLPEGRGHVPLQYAQHEGPDGWQEVRKWLCGGRRRV